MIVLLQFNLFSQNLKHVRYPWWFAEMVFLHKAFICSIWWFSQLWWSFLIIYNIKQNKTKQYKGGDFVGLPLYKGCSMLNMYTWSLATIHVIYAEYSFYYLDYEVMIDLYWKGKILFSHPRLKRAKMLSCFFYGQEYWPKSQVSRIEYIYNDVCQPLFDVFKLFSLFTSVMVR